MTASVNGPFSGGGFDLGVLGETGAAVLDDAADDPAGVDARPEEAAVW